MASAAQSFYNSTVGKGQPTSSTPFISSRGTTTAAAKFYTGVKSGAIKNVSAPQPQNSTKKVAVTDKNKGFFDGLFAGFSLDRLKESLSAGTQQAIGSVKTGLGALRESNRKQSEKGPSIYDKLVIGKDGKLAVDKSNLERQKIENAKLIKQGNEQQNKAGERLNKMGKAEGKGTQLIEGLTQNAPGFAASTGIATATLLITKNPQLAATLGFSNSYAQTAGQMYNEAKNYGVSDEKAFDAANKGGLAVGVIDQLPLGRILSRTPQGEAIKKKLVTEVVKSFVLQGGEEATTEGVQQVIQNALAKVYYDPSRKLLDGAGESALYGFIMGGTSGALSDISTAVNIPDQKKLNLANEKIDEAINTPRDKRSEEQQNIVNSVLRQDFTPTQIIQYVAKSDIATTSEGHDLIKTALDAQRNGKNLSFIQDEDTGEITIEIADQQEVKAVESYDGRNVTPENVVSRSPESKLVSFDNIVSVKEEKPQSLDRAKNYIDQAGKGEMKARKPIKAIKLKSGKYLVTDGNATVQTLKNQGYSDVPIQLEDTAKIAGSDITDEQLIDSAKEHFKASENSKVYGALFTEIANKLGLKKIGESDRSSVKSIVGIAEKRYIRNREIRDAVRDTIIINKPEDVLKIVQELESRGLTGKAFNSERRTNGLKNRFTDTTPGYKDANFQFTAPDGQVVELQMMQKHMHDAKQKIGHAMYDLDKVKNNPNLTEEQKAAIEEVNAQSDLIYQRAFILDNSPSGTDASLMSEGMSSAETPPLLSASSITSIKGALNTLRDASSASVKSAVENVESAISNNNITDNKTAGNRQNNTEPKGTGKTKESALFKRVKEVLGAEFDSQRVTYNELSLEKQAQAVTDLIENDPKRAARIAQGLEEVSQGMTQNAVSLGLFSVASGKGDFQTAADLLSSTSLRSTRLGQELVSLRGAFNGDTPENAVKRIIQSRLEKISDQYKSEINNMEIEKDVPKAKKATKLIERQAKDLKKRLTDEQHKRINSAQEVIEMLKCK